jgi:ATP-binding cassette subfamily B protein/subfamily B ATP-binding cassette protein MsbA
MTLGELVGFIFYLPLFYDPIGRLHRLNQMFQAARASSERIYDIIDTTEEGANRQNAVALSQPVRGDVRYRNVSFSYGTSIDALKDITLHARPGQMIALVGPTGAGKSTLVNLLLAFYQRSAGKIEIDGQDIDRVTIESLRGAIGVVSQDVFLFNGTIRENVLFACGDATDEDVFAACRAANCHEFIQALPDGYDSRVGERGIRLSVGERQRISIARAILKNAPILILDEATASVDTATEHLIQEALQRLTSHRTSFVVAHRLSTVRHADQIIVLRHGEIVERGTHAELLKRDGLYRMLCRTQDETYLDGDMGRILSFASSDVPKTMAAEHER